MKFSQVSGAFAVGLFWAFIPFPSQMLMAAATAIPARVNLPISVALVWITNPVTIPPMFYFAYLVGTWILGTAPQPIEFELTMACLTESLAGIWQPLLLGSLVCATISAAIGFFGMRALWRLHIIRHLKQRRSRGASEPPMHHAD